MVVTVLLLSSTRHWTCKKDASLYSLISILKTYQPSSHFTPWSLSHWTCSIVCHFSSTESIQFCNLSAHWACRRHCHFCPTRYSFEIFESEVPCPWTHHRNSVPILCAEKHDISLKILHLTGFETARQTAISAKRRAPSIAPCLFGTASETVTQQTQNMCIKFIQRQRSHILTSKVGPRAVRVKIGLECW